MSCANNVLPVYMWPSPGKIPEALCLPPVQVDTVHFSSEATETNGFSRLSSSLNRTAVVLLYYGFENTGVNDLGEAIYEKPLFRDRIHPGPGENLFDLARVNYP